ncbi:MAG: D-glycero-beta-D-manno-heptose 1-phosphate adenylyltransferase [candidate division Zixibacteria bacterium]|nr:D-glycero-beta-D-manno-heptose 1-phosphate adenylyltransferase [candidate division Zixibacteria bacterium]
MAPKALIPLSGISTLTARLRRSGRKIVFTNGVFDIIHRGHVDYLAKARSFGDLLIVGLNTDASVRRLKGKGRPVQPQSDRAAILLALRSVDYVVLFADDTPARLIEKVRPDVLVKGADYALSDIVGAKFVKSYGGSVKRVRLVKGRSTSALVRLLGGQS